MKVLLVGETNPYNPEARFALYPLPAGASGGRLAKILGMTARDYLRTFDRMNLVSGAWSLQTARDTARSRTTAPYRILLGRRVCAAHGVEFRPFTTVSSRTQRWVSCVILPHPSGRSRLWNAPTAASRARRLVRALVRAAELVS